MDLQNLAKDAVRVAGVASIIASTVLSSQALAWSKDYLVAVEQTRPDKGDKFSRRIENRPAYRNAAFEFAAQIKDKRVLSNDKGTHLRIAEVAVKGSDPSQSIAVSTLGNHDRAIGSWAYNSYASENGQKMVDNVYTRASKEFRYQHENGTRMDFALYKDKDGEEKIAYVTQGRSGYRPFDQDRSQPIIKVYDCTQVLDSEKKGHYEHSSYQRSKGGQAYAEGIPAAANALCTDGKQTETPTAGAIIQQQQAAQGMARS